MSRSPVHVRDAVPADAEALLEVWAGFSDRLPAGSLSSETAASVARIAAAPDELLLVAVVEDRVIGAVHLVRAALSPVHTATAVQVNHLHVVESCRKRGVGRALLEATVSWAEEKDTDHVLAVAAANSRDANRFMARLGLGQVAVVRGSSVIALRAKLPVEPPSAARVGQHSHRNVGQVIARRRSLRRAQEKTS